MWTRVREPLRIWQKSRSPATIEETRVPGTVETEARRQQRQTEPTIREAVAAVVREPLEALASAAVAHSDVL